MKSVLFLLVAAAALPAIAVAKPVDNSKLVMLDRVAARMPYNGAAQSDLGIAYLRADRASEARAAFERVLQLDNVTLTTRTGEDIWSHTLARRMLARDMVIAAR